MVSVLDESIGNITQALERLGLLDDTIIFFTSDVSEHDHHILIFVIIYKSFFLVFKNGGAIYAAGRNYPLRGGKLRFWKKI